MKQAIRFCSSPDGVRLAVGTHGSGPPLVRVATWMTPAIALFALVEKLAPPALRVRYAAAVALVAWGVATLVGAGA